MCTDQNPNKPADSSTIFPPLIHDVVVLTGPTASGKSSLAVALAKKIDGEILSLDSIAVYRKMNIGTAKPSPEEQQGIQHHLLDLVDPNEDYSVACYLKQAHQAVEQIRSRNKKPIFVGGTPMFLKGILRGFNPGPPADWNFRESVEKDLKEFGPEALQARLRQVDPLAAHRIHLSDTRRMIRALEFAKLTGAPISHQQTQFESTYTAQECNVFTLAWPRDVLHRRINQRVEKMFQVGLIDEIKRLVEQFGELSRTARQAVGYREILNGLAEGQSQSEMMEEVAAHTRQLARRQETWFRSFQEIQAIPMSENQPIDETVDSLINLLH